jgi:HNH endonuclease
MTKSIPLYNRAGRKLYSLVDKTDFERLNQFRWRKNAKGYAIRSFVVNDQEIVIALHRNLMQPMPPGYVVDHRDHDKLNNTRANLRLLTPSENLVNRRLFCNSSTGFKGVTFQHGKWHTRVERDEQVIHLGFHADLKTAALVYDCGVMLLFGADIPLRNLPNEPIPVAIELYVRGILAKKGWQGC